ncbi:hypothetical protein EVA_13448, partial [gut metagenome]
IPIGRGKRLVIEFIPPIFPIIS